MASELLCRLLQVCLLVGFVLLEASAAGSLKVGRLEGDVSRSLAAAGAASEIVMTIEAVEKMQVVEQELTAEFLLIALGKADTSTLDAEIAWMDQHLAGLAQGDEALHLIPPPGDSTNQTLVLLTQHFGEFKELLLSNLETVAPESTDLLLTVAAKNQELEHELKELEHLYEAFGILNGEYEPPEVRAILRAAYVQEDMAKLSLLAVLQVKPVENFEKADKSADEFEALSHSLVWGNPIVQLERATLSCVVTGMYKISGAWTYYRAAITSMRFGMATDSATALIGNFTATRATLRQQLQDMTDVFHGDFSSCGVTYTEQQWLKGAEEKNRLRILAQASIRKFLQLKLDGTSDEAQRTDVWQEIVEARNTAEYVFQGDYARSVPPPATQVLLDEAAKVWDMWHLLEVEIELALTSTESMQDEALEQDLFEKSDKLDVAMDNFSSLYVEAALKVHATTRIVVSDLSYRQRALVEKMSKQALKIALKDSAVNETGRFEQTIGYLQVGHEELLLGSKASAILKIVGVPRTTGVCLLNLMFQVDNEIKALIAILQQLFGAKDFLNNHVGFIAAEAANPLLVQAFEAFEAGWESFRTNDVARSQDLRVAYIFSNPNAVGSKDNFDFAPGGEDYHQAHAQYHPVYRDILYARNYYDIFFFDLRGNLIYSVYKELDYATNFAANGTGVWKDSGLGEAFRAAMLHPNKINIIDWKPYGPSYGALASFLSTGIKKNGALIGIFCTQMPPESKPITSAEMVPQLQAVNLAQMRATNAYTNAGAVTCPQTLSAQEWELALEKISRLEYKFQKTETEFALLASGFTAQWLAGSTTGLEAHKQYLVLEAAKPELVEAMWSFKQAWNSFRETDAERLLSLQIAYILLNPHPTGSKDALDFAEGVEDYHKVHAQYHPQYRDILYERNYYDIFFLDTEGNCIYSVYKELDYATNFLADGPGDWKDSGLGEAFRAAMANPDGINVIDWKPYGPSNGALASFLSTGIHRLGDLIGVFCTQLPPELTPRDSAVVLEKNLQEMTGVLWNFRYGNKALSIFPPKSQRVADALFNASDIWVGFDEELHAVPTVEALKVILHHSDDFSNYANVLNLEILAGAYAQQPQVEGAKIQMASEQMALLQHMERDVVLLAMGGFDHVRSSLPYLVEKFESNQRVLLHGNMGRRLAMTDVAQVIDFEAEKLLVAVDDAWATLKPEMTHYINEKISYAFEDVRIMLQAMDAAIETTLSMATYLSTTTRTTTMVTLEILTPLPLTGNWNGGQTFRLAARLAEDIINKDQIILPGYQIKHAFYDDKCNPSTASDVVVSAMAEKGNSFVALAGMGCDEVCRQVSSLSVSMRLPFMSYECAHTDFSDTATYPALTRMGTPTTQLFDVVDDLRTRYSWQKIYVVSGDPAQYQAEAESLRDSFQALGLASEWLYARDTKWNEITQVMNTIKLQSPGLERVVFFTGSETLYRKLVCASITQQLTKGIVWLSRGTWRREWWKQSDILTSTHRYWLSQDVYGRTLRQAFPAFKSAWDSYSPDVNTTRTSLYDLYVTDAKETLDFAEGPERYHTVHQQWHPTFRAKLEERAYYDIFMFDLDGNLIYSVYKEADYATNFRADGTGPWKDSGLGQAFQRALASPDNITYIEFAPYGPSNNAPAAFLSTGLHDEEGVLIGVYSIQLPPEYEKSIEDIEPSCTFARLTAAFQGAINIAGLGRPSQEFMEKPLPCLKGYSPQSFLTLLDKHLETGYPEGDRSTVVRDPYNAIKAHAVDGLCAIAYGIQFLLQQGHSVADIQTPSVEVYDKMMKQMREQLDFQGVSGRVKFDGNDRENMLVVEQVQSGGSVEVAFIPANATISWVANGTTDSYWQIEPAEVFELMWILHPLALGLAILCPCLIGCFVAYRLKKSWSSQQRLPNQQ